jgi:hypothetical protein
VVMRCEVNRFVIYHLHRGGGLVHVEASTYFFYRSKRHPKYA